MSLVFSCSRFTHDVKRLLETTPDKLWNSDSQLINKKRLKPHTFFVQNVNHSVSYICTMFLSLIASLSSFRIKIGQSGPRICLGRIVFKTKHRIKTQVDCAHSHLKLPPRTHRLNTSLNCLEFPFRYDVEELLFIVV